MKFRTFLLDGVTLHTLSSSPVPRHPAAMEEAKMARFTVTIPGRAPVDTDDAAEMMRLASEAQKAGLPARVTYRVPSEFDWAEPVGAEGW